MDAERQFSEEDAGVFGIADAQEIAEAPSINEPPLERDVEHQKRLDTDARQKKIRHWIEAQLLSEGMGQDELYDARWDSWGLEYGTEAVLDFVNGLYDPLPEDALEYQGFLTPEQSRRVDEFLQVLVTVAEEHVFSARTSGAPAGWVDKIFRRIYKRYFSYSPNILTEDIDPARRFALGVRIARYSEMDNVFSSSALFNITLSLQEASDGWILQSIEHMPVAEQMASASYLIEMLNAAMGEVEETRTLRQVAYVCRAVLAKDVHPLVRMRFEQVAARIAKANVFFDVGVPTVSSAGRHLAEQMHAEVKQVARSTGDEQWSNFIRLSRDMIATVDTSWRVQMVAPVRGEEQTGAWESMEGVITQMDPRKDTAEKIDIASLYKTIHHPDMVLQMQEEYGIVLADLTLREQMWFVDFLGRADRPTVERLQVVTRQHGVEVARTFLALGEHSAMGDIILSIAETLGDDARPVFEQFGALIDLTEKSAEQLFQSFFVDEADETVDVDRVQKHLLRRSAQLLRDVYSRALVGKTDPEQIQRDIDRYKSDIVLFTSIFAATYHDRRDVDFGMVRDLSLATLRPEEVTDADKAEMMRIHTENWNQQSPELAPDLNRDFMQALQRGDRELVVLKWGKEILAFARFDHEYKGKSLPEDVVYVGSLNVNGLYQSSAIGTVALHKMFDRMAQEKRVIGVADTRDRIGMRYVEEFCVLLTGVARGVKGTSKDDFYLLRDVEGSRALLGPSLTAEALQRPPEGVFVRQFDLDRDYTAFLSFVESETGQGRVISRYFYDAENPSLRTVVSEPWTGERAVVTPADVVRPQEEEQGRLFA